LAAQRPPPHVPQPSWSDDYRLLVDSVSDYAVFMLDPAGRVMTWNRGAERIKRYTPDEIIGEHFSRFYPREDIEGGKPDQELKTAVEMGRVEDEGWRLRKDGSRFWANVVITALRGPGGELRGFAKVTRDLTERKRAEEELRRSEERFRLLVEGVTDYAIYMLDPTGHVTTWNSGAERIKGYGRDEIIGKHFGMFFSAEQQAEGAPARELAIAAEEGRYEEESWRTRKDGTQLWANVVLTALRGPSGELLGFAKVTRDLTMRRAADETARELLREQVARASAEEAEGRLREERERYKALSRRLEVILEGVADGIMVQDRSERLIFANSTAATLCGFPSVDALLQATSAEVLARFDIRDEQGGLVDPQDLPGRKVLAGEPAATTLLHLRARASGQQSWASLRATAVIGPDGRPELAVNIWHDISEQRRREERERYLARATATLSSSLDYESTLSSLAALLVPGLADWCSIHLLDGEQLEPVAVAHFDPAKVSLAHEYHAKYPPDLRQSRGLGNVLRTGEPELYEHVTAELMEQGARDAEHLDILRGIGMKSLILVPIRVRDRVSGTISLVSAEGGRRYDRADVALAEELGRRAGTSIENARLYEQAQSAATRAEEASRVKDEFLATVSHELRTPLNAILGWASLLQGQSADASLAKGLDVIHRNAQAQAKIVDDILDVSRIITGKLRLELGPADLVAIVHDAIEVVRPSALAKSISIELTPPAEPCLLVADPARLQQVVWNLLSNAVKFTDAGGSIRIAVGRQLSKLVVSVTDTGRGIDPAFLPYVFDRFMQADGSTRSSGTSWRSTVDRSMRSAPASGAARPSPSRSRFEPSFPRCKTPSRDRRERASDAVRERCRRSRGCVCSSSTTSLTRVSSCRPSSSSLEDR
jgi:PAS domain S-box-containing protein